MIKSNDGCSWQTKPKANEFRGQAVHSSAMAIRHSTAWNSSRVIHLPSIHLKPLWRTIYLSVMLGQQCPRLTSLLYEEKDTRFLLDLQRKIWAIVENVTARLWVAGRCYVVVKMFWLFLVLACQLTQFFNHILLNALKCITMNKIILQTQKWEFTIAEFSLCIVAFF